MPPTHTKGRRLRSIRDSSDSEMDVSPPPSQASPSNLACSSADAVTAIVRAIIFRDQSKEPFKQSEIFKLALNKSKVNEELWNYALQRLRDTFGFVVQPIGDEGLLIVIKEKPSTISMPINNESCHDGVLVIVLGMIFMSGGSLDEDALISALADLNMHLVTLIHLPGDRVVAFKDLLNSVWRKQMYVDYKEIRNERKAYIWGLRSHIEVSKPAILNLMARIMNSKPEQWRDQYRVAYGKDPKRFYSSYIDESSQSVHNSTVSSAGLRSNSSNVVTMDDDQDEIEVLSESRSQNRSPLKPLNISRSSTRALRRREPF